MPMGGFDRDRIERLRAVVQDNVERDHVGGVAWLAALDDHGRWASPAR